MRLSLPALLALASLTGAACLLSGAREYRALDQKAAALEQQLQVRPDAPSRLATSDS